MAKTNQDVFSAVFQDCAGSKSHGTTLVDANAAEGRTHISKL